MSKTSLSARFLSAVGLAGGQEKPSADNSALAKERDDAVALVAKADTAYNALADAKAAADAEAETALAALKANHAAGMKVLSDQVAALTKEIADAKAAAPEKEAALRTEILNKEVAAVAGAQGVPPGDIAPQAKAGDAGESIATLSEQLKSEQDPKVRGQIATKIKKLRESN